MSGAMRKMAVYLGLVEDERYDEYDETDEQGRERPGRRPGDRFGERLPERHGERLEERRPLVALREEGRGSVATMGERRTITSVPTQADLARITTIHPQTYNEARTIGEEFREGTPVIMNLTEMGDSDAKRLVDFAAGLVFGLHGSIEKVTSKVFLLSPANVTVTAEDKARMAESGFFNQS